MTGASAEVVRQWLTNPERDTLPNIIQNLLILEKSSKADPSLNITETLLGSWQLILIGGKQSLATYDPTQKGNGKVLPRWLNIQLTYESNENSNSKAVNLTGQIKNQVQLGEFSLTLTGPWQYYAKPRIMAFDFLYLGFAISGRSLFSLPIRGGKKAEAQFWDQTLKEQAFFRYFWVTPAAIAARGRGGGIALWKKVEPSLGQGG